MEGWMQNDEEVSNRLFLSVIHLGSCTYSVGLSSMIDIQYSMFEAPMLKTRALQKTEMGQMTLRNQSDEGRT